MISEAPIIDITSSICRDCERKFNEFDDLNEQLCRRKSILRTMIRDASKIFKIKIEAVDIKNEPEVIVELGEGNIPFEYDVDEDHYFAQDEESQIDDEIESGTPDTKELPMPVEEKRARFKPANKSNESKPVVKERKIYQCPLCPKMFGNPTSYKCHKDTHIIGKSHVCPTCGKSFKTELYLKSHNRVHINYNKFVCDICGHLFSAKPSMRKHIEAVHSRTMKYLCYLCPKAYSGENSLKKHIASHTTGKDLSCHICDAKFQ